MCGVRFEPQTCMHTRVISPKPKRRTNTPKAPRLKLFGNVPSLVKVTLPKSLMPRRRRPTTTGCPLTNEGQPHLKSKRTTQSPRTLSTRQQLRNRRRITRRRNSLPKCKSVERNEQPQQETIRATENKSSMCQKK